MDWLKSKFKYKLPTIKMGSLIESAIITIIFLWLIGVIGDILIVSPINFYKTLFGLF